MMVLQGWLGSGKKGAVVLDNLNISHLMEEEGESLAVSQAPSTLSSTSPHPGCLHDKDKGSCAASFKRFYYR